MEEVMWMIDLEPKLFAIIKSKALPRLIKDFPKIKFTSSDSNFSSTANFPCVYIHTLPGTEIGTDLTNESINGVLYSMQIEVYTDSSQTDARKVMGVIVGVLKELRFTINSIPEFDNLSNVYRQIVRCRRIIGAGDVFYS